MPDIVHIQGSCLDNGNTEGSSGLEFIGLEDLS